MLSLYEILKASKTGIAPDMWTALAGMNWSGADSGHEVKELTGIPPLSFRADGTPLLDYLISGNMSQTGTPTPDNPIMPEGCGERTGNLFPLDATKLHVGRIEKDGTIDYEVGTITVGTDSVTYEANTAWRGFYTDFIQVNENKKLTFSPNNKSYMSWACTCYDENDNFLGSASTRHALSTITFTLLTRTKKVRINVTSSNTTYTVLRPMLNTGSEALPYEPYGIKIPISSANTTTPVYLGEVESTRRIEKLVLTGNENWGNIGTNEIFNLQNLPVPATAYANQICSHFPLSNSWSSVATTDNTFAVTTTDNQLVIHYSSAASVTDFKAYLAQQYANSTPVIVWYVLAEPTTGIVNEPLRKIGNYADTVSYEQAGVQIPTIKGNTVIDVDTTLKPSEMYIKYQK